MLYSSGRFVYLALLLVLYYKTASAQGSPQPTQVLPEETAEKDLVKLCDKRCVRNVRSAESKEPKNETNEDSPEKKKEDEYARVVNAFIEENKQYVRRKHPEDACEITTWARDPLLILSSCGFIFCITMMALIHSYGYYFFIPSDKRAELLHYRQNLQALRSVGSATTLPTPVPTPGEINVPGSLTRTVTPTLTTPQP